MPAPLGPLGEAIAAAARRDPERVALADGVASRSYGELAQLLAAAGEGGGEGAGRWEEAGRDVIALAPEVGAVEAVLRRSLGGESLLLLDPKATAAERERAAAIFSEAGEGADAGERPCVGLTTSGSSGLPKVVELGWESLLANAASFAAAAGYEAADTIWCTTPLAHLYGFGVGVLAGLLSGAMVLLGEGTMAPPRFAATLREQRPTVLLSVPFLYRRYLAMLEQEPELAADWSLRCCIAAGEPVAPELVEAWRRRTGLGLRAHYGLTEGGHVTLASGGPGEGVGRPLDDVELRIGEGGAIELRRRAPQRPYRVIGEQAGSDGWRDSGDLGHLDGDGNLHVDGRADRRINFAGKKVDPDEVEAALLECAGVADGAVAGVAGPDGERVVAFLVAAPGSEVGDGEIRAELAARLSPHKLPRRFVRVGEIPRTLTGKVRRGELIAALGEGGGDASVGGDAGASPDAGAGRRRRGRELLELVRSEVAATVLGHGEAAAVDPDVSFKDLGFDSLAAVELGNRLGAATGRELPATAAFDHPTPRALAGFLGAGAGAGAAIAVEPARPLAAAGGADPGEPIAIVGMACRYPGGADSPAALWRLLAAGEDAISPFPENRGWDLERLLDPDPDRPGSSYGREGGFLADVAGFDAEFFGISPREALAMDPQQRLLLETAWEALEEAGIDPASLAGSATGVFAGAMRHDYWQRGARAGALEAYQGVGSAASVLSGRISYALGLRGPAISVDTACSSSLVATHLAAAALRGGECDLALAGGATVMSTPWPFVEFSRQRGLAPDGRCKSFDDAADGTGFAEGAGLVLLERLADARRNGHPVLAVIRGSATNQDGASNGLTAPNGPAQERVIRQALANAGLEPGAVDAVEAHGTGTRLGDPIEARALLATYGRERGEAAPLALGSIKSNIGHAQAAAGIAGVIKMTLALQNGLLPRTLHVEEPSPRVDWDAGAVELLSEEREWGPGERPRRAGVSSFGISGTNVHLILEEAPAAAGVGEATGDAPHLREAPLLLAAKSAAALGEQAERLAARLGEQPAPGRADLGFSLATGRAALAHRAAVLGPEPAAALAALAAGEPHPDLLHGVAGSGRFAFVFPGQGSQWAGMGRELLASSPVFAAGIAACEEALAPFAELSLAAVLGGDVEAEPVDVVQPALFATMVALARLWRHHGCEPEAVVGHSQGEIAAAHVAGALSLEDAARVVALRSQALAELSGRGGMLSVHLPAAAVAERIEPWGAALGIAAENSPLATVVSGEPGALEELVAACAADGVRTRMVAVDYASHSPQVEAIRERLLRELAPIEPRPGEIPFYSALHGGRLDGGELGAEYWYRSLREPVRFAGAVAALLGDGCDAFVEASAHPVLTSAVAESAGEAGVAASAIATLRRDEGGLDRFAAALAEAHVAGVAVDWARLYAGSGARRVALPTYPFQRRRFWLDAGDGGGELGGAGQSASLHPLLGAAISLPDEAGWLLSGRLSRAGQPWLSDHLLHGSAILPGAALAEIALAAAEEAGLAGIGGLALEAPLALPERGAVQLQVSVGGADAAGDRPLEIHSRPDDEDAAWVRHASGTLAATTPLAEGLEEWPPPGAKPVALGDFYERVAALGVEYGPAFQGLRALWCRDEDLYAEVELAEEQALEAERFGLHPALLDAALHPALLAAEESGELRVPFSWEGVRLAATGATRLRVRLRPRGEALSLLLAGPGGEPLGAVETLALRPLDRAQLHAADAAARSLFAVEWQALELPQGAEEPSAPCGDARAGDGQEPPRRFECVPDADLDPATAAQALCAEVLSELQDALEASVGEGQVAFVTRGAVAVGEGESPDPAAAAVWGLVRSAQAEHPGRFLLLDADDSAASEAAIDSALALAEEPQIALREGGALVPRVALVGESSDEAPSLDPDATVLVTGGTGALGGLFARHLAGEHGVRHLVLVSRRGPDAPGADGLVAELAELGAAAEVVAADVSDRAQVEALIDSISAEHPLTAVVHAAGTTDDGTVESLDSDRLATTLGPKADAAWHLHELTAALTECELVLFSSVAGTLPTPGQGNYAAANAFLDALAARRRAEGLAATSLAWGAWERESELTARLGAADRARIARGGIGALADAEGLALFDRARALPRAQLLAARLESGPLRAAARAGTLPRLLSGLVRAPARAAASGSLAERLAGLGSAEAEAVSTELVRAHVAAVLGHSDSARIDPGAAFKDLGFDSLTAVELRNRLGQASGLRLPATLAFDHPSAAAVARLLRELAAGGQRRGAGRAATPARAGEPVAIVGMSCRYPGAVASPEQLWQLLAAGGDGVSPFPSDRGWPLERLFDPDPDRLGRSYVREGGFLHDAAEFDAPFFGISPREALVMDPQQRLLLEAAWEAIEDAGIDPTTLAGSGTGVFAGTMHHDYARGGAAATEAEGQQGLGTAGAVLSGRVAYSLGLEGPAITVDTACSSSLVALHLAAGALRGGECELALAGGISVMSTPAQFVELSRQRSLAPDGRSKSFDAAADGTGFSEGVGLVLLERLADARRNGHPVLAVIRGSATNQDGASNGLTAPNGPAQERVIRQALASAGLEPGEVDAVEAHGTGTVLGDPIEAQALLATYGQGRERPLALGSIKSNIGHTQAAAGVAGVIKMTLALRHGMLPRTLHLLEPTPHVDWESGAVELLTEERQWVPGERPRRAAVSSFGISGTNAHLILEEAPAAAAGDAAGEPPLPLVPLLLSAKSEGALAAQARQVAARLREDEALDPAAVGLTLASSRAGLGHRAAALGADRAELLAALEAIAAGEPHAGARRGRAGSGRLAFLFPGQGPQWVGMGRELLAASPFFAAEIEACEAALAPHVEFSLVDVLRGEAHDERVEVIQPALFAMTVGLTNLWRSFGARPGAVLGHSQGEVAAAYIAGALSLEDAARVVALRSQALRDELAGRGGMVSLHLGAEAALELIEPWRERLAVGAINSPRSTVISGEPAALEELTALCAERAVPARRLVLDCASHSPQAEALHGRLLADLAPIRPRAATEGIAFYSALTGEPLDGAELGPEYWYQSMRATVRFGQGAESLLAAGFDCLVEASVHPVLTVAVEETAAARGTEVAAVASLRREQGGLDRFAAALAEAHIAGVELERARLFAPGTEPAPLPTYPFQRQRYWLEPSPQGTASAGAIGLEGTEHPLLGASLQLPGEAGWLFTGRLSQQTHPWVAEHVLHGSALLPGTVFVEIALRAAEQADLAGIGELAIEAPLLLAEQGAIQLQVKVGEESEAGDRPIEIHSRPEGSDAEWTRHASGRLTSESADAAAVPELAGEWPPPGAEPLGNADLYERIAELGIDYGPAFQGLKQAWQDGEDLYAEVELAPEQAEEAERFAVHPALLDAALHPALLQGDGEVQVPFSFSGVCVHAGGPQALRVRLSREGERLALHAAGPDGAPVVGIEALAVRGIEAAALRSDSAAGSLFRIEWAQLPLPQPAATAVRRFECVPDPELDPAAAALDLCAEALAALQGAVAEGAGESRVAFLTHGAVAVGEGESPDPAAAAVWGLVRSAQAEHPGRFLLLDADDSEDSEAAIAAALAIDEEPQIALREGVATVPRLARIGRSSSEASDFERSAASDETAFDPNGTVLITGGTGALGGLFAKHLASALGVRHLVLVSRRGPDAPGSAELLAQLRELGAEAEAVAADVSDRVQLEAVFDSIAAEHPLTAVVHAAGTTDDGTVESLDRERLAATLAPKADAAWYLHELTAALPGCELVLFSSFAATIQSPGQANYAAANAFLDALAQQRRAAGLPALALGWGAWERQSELTAGLAAADRARIERAGVRPLADAEGTRLLDRARAAGEARLAAVALDPAELRRAARAGTLPPLFSGLVRVPTRRAAAAGGALAGRLAAATAAERGEIALELVRTQVAAVLGHADAAQIEPGAAFKDLGFDSLTAVELRNRLDQVSGLRLPATLVFDHPTAAAVSEFLLAEVGGGRAAAPVRARRRAEEPIALVGIGCRFPGGVASADDLWRLVAAGGDAIGPFPADRGWDRERLYHPDPDHPGTSNAREGGFLHEAGEFDAAFFGVSPREARTMDPQQRLLLEVAWEALEDASLDPAGLAGSATGVFAGLMHHDYGLGGSGSTELGGLQGAVSSGSLASGHVAYSLGLEGPAMTVDTACSSSLVAMHLAAQALRAGECELALAGGSTVLATPGLFIEFSHQRGLAADGRSKSFAAGADGTGLAEGVGLVLLERLSDAERNGHEPIALIRGSATNQDGASNGITAPNGPAQERVIRQALANAGLEPGEVDAVEAHGTGTVLGDPIEAGAILATYGQGRGEAPPLALGSIKSNIGHAQAAAGVAGVIKMAMALRHGVLPRSLHLDAPSPHVDWESGAVELLREEREWEPGERPRRAGISSFGISGTNAHLILEEAGGIVAEIDAAPPAAAPPPLLLSARSEGALRQRGRELAAHLRAHPELERADVAATLATSRASLPHRAAVLAADGELLEALDALATGEPDGAVIAGRAGGGKLAFLFSGQGAQRPRMGRELYAAFPAFAAALDESCAALDRHLERPLEELLFAAPDSEAAALLDRTEYTQPALFAVEVALYRLLESWGVRPDHLIGHSVGELAAAHVAGVLDLAGAATLIAARGALMGALPEGGAMVAVEASEAEVLAELPEGLAIAAVNSPSSVVVSGAEAAVLELAAGWERQGRRSSRLRVSHAFHSELMDPMLAEFEAVARGLEYREPQLPIVSNVSGETLAPERATDPAYWVAQVRQPVRFAAGVEHLAAAGVGTMLELGPDAVLSAMAAATLAGAERQPAALPLLRRDRPEPATLLAGLAAAHVGGVAVAWERLLPGRPVPLPTYPFQRQRYWLEPSQGNASAGAIGLDSAEHPLLGASLQLPGEAGWLLTGRLSQQTHPWVAEHVLHGSALLPGTAFVEIALRAAEQAGLAGVGELAIEAPLLLPESGAIQLQVKVGEESEDGARPIEIHSRPEGSDAEWSRHASGTLTSEITEATEAPELAGEWPPPGAEPLGNADLYERIAELGIDYGPAFQGLKQAWQDGEDLYAEVELAPEQAEEAERFAVHPALLDAALHPALLQSDGEVQVPFSFSGVSVHAGGAQALRVRLSREGERLALHAVDPDGVPVVGIEALAVRGIEAVGLDTGVDIARSLFEIEWNELSLPSASASASVAATAGDEEPPTRRFYCIPTPGLDPAAAAEALCAEVLAELQGALALVGEQQVDEQRVAFVTRGAVAVRDGESPDPAAAAVWGLVRSAQAEHPGRFFLLDADDSEASEAAIDSALAIDEEPQIALRRGVVTVPRLARVGDADGTGRVESDGTTGRTGIDASALDPDGTVLVTGGTGALGGLFAKHLASEHGVRHLVLVSRRGPDAPGADELVAELTELGAEAQAVAADVSDRAQLEAVIDSIAAEHPLTAVVHAAGAGDDALVDALDAVRFATAFAPKATAAWHLHELTAGLPGCELILFSSAAACFQAAGQGNYAAANAFLDALAQRRRADGLPALALGWGAWERESELTAGLGEADRARRARDGIGALGDAEGLALFDRARALGRPRVLPIRLDEPALRAVAREGSLPPLLRGLVRAPARRAAAGSLAERLAAAPTAERERLVAELVRSHVAAVLGHPSGTAIDPEAAFKELGFDSLAAVELRNRLERASGLRLPATLVFDHPNAAAVSGFLAQLAVGAERPRPARAATRTRSEEPIAIVGMSCRLPGGACSPQRLWQLLASGTDAIAGFPEDRGWDLERLYDPAPESRASYVREGGFLYDAAEFDAGFFAIAPREALTMDPQQRLLLEAAWEALEDAGLDPAALAGSDTGVFAGQMHHDYGLGSAGSAELGGHQGAVSAGAIASGHVAYSFGFEGPAMTVDTACSSSLVAMHLASAALRAGECGLALAGGATVLSTPGLFVEFSRQRNLARDGRSKSFDAAADGTGFSEGVGLVLLERLADAERNGHEPIALIRGSATNQDGASNGLTAPNGPAQERVIMQALASAGLEPGDVDAVEAHGTGTVLGDPIEAQAILATYGQGRGEAPPLALGSIKSNIGHSQAAAGVAGVIKMALALRHGLLPRTLHLREPTPHVDWSAGEVELLSEARAWEPGERTRRAGVSSFGLSGTNAHVILEEAPRRPSSEAAETSAPADGEAPASPNAAPAAAEPPLPLAPLLLSGKGEAALAAQARQLAAHLRAEPGLERADVARALARRSRLGHRAFVLGAGEEQLTALDALAAGEPHPALLSGRAGVGKLAFLFPGQGPQWVGMGRELLEASPLFAARIDACAEALRPHVEFDLRAVVAGAAHDERVDVIQPALFAMTVALAALWRSFGVEPDAVLGHSQGEVAAAHVAGALSLEDAARVVALRSQALRDELAGKGGMVSLQLPEDEAAELIGPWGEVLSVGAINSPRSTVISGDPDALDELSRLCEERGVRARRLALDCASHSPQAEVLRERLLHELAPIEPRPTTGPAFYSALSGELLDGAELGPEYWYRSMRSTVRFGRGVESLLAASVDAFVEPSVHPVLTMAVEETAAAAGATVATIGSLRREEGGLARFAVALGAAHIAGVGLDPARLLAPGPRAALPTYAFQRQRYWLEPVRQGEGEPAAIGQSDADHPLLGAAISLPREGGWLLTGRLSPQTHPWIADHVLMGSPLLPGTGFLEMALKAAELAGMEAVGELAIEAPLLLPEGGAVQVQVQVGEADESGNRPLEIHSRPEDAESEWVRNASGSLAAEAPAPPEPLGEWPPPGAEPIALDGFYEHTASLGIDYGAAFQGARAVWRRGETLFAEAELAPEQAEEAGRFAIHPALLDAALHTAFLAQAAGEDPKAPFSFSGVRVGAGGAATLRVRQDRAGSDAIAVVACDAAGAPVASIASLSSRAIDASQLRAAAAPSADSLFAIGWRELAAPAPADASAPGGGGEVRVVECLPNTDLDPAAAAQALCSEVLAELQDALENAGEQRVAFVTRGAVAAREGEVPDPAAAAVWGLVRSAQAEHPGRFLLLDADESDASAAALAAALATAEEPQLALREGAVLVPRLQRLAPPAAEASLLDPEGTVLITGGTGALGGIFAKHLAVEHGIRHLVLTSRRGPDAPGAAALVAELAELGAEAEAVACDAGDREQLRALFAAVPAERPLTAVLHAAAVFDNGLVDSLDPARLAYAMGPKSTAAWHLHELTAELPGCELVLFSSIAASLQNPGQGNYAAANAFLDALAQRRRAEGLPGRSLAWGYWDVERVAQEEGLAAADVARLGRTGLAEMPAAAALALFDRVRALPDPFLITATLDLAALRGLARAQMLPPLFAGLVRAPSRRAGGGASASLAARLTEVAEGEREEVVVELVRSHAAVVLGHASGAAIDPTAAFKDLGFDSLTAVELRNRLEGATGLQLPATLVFDYPSTEAVAGFLLAEVGGPAAPVDTDRKLDTITSLLGSIAVEERERALARLQSFLAGLAGEAQAEEAEEVDLESASDEELLQLIDGEFGNGAGRP